MKLKHTIPIALLFLFLYCNMSYAEISQNFDSSGNIISSRGRSSENRLSGGRHRYYVPEGIELQKDIRYEFYPVFGKTFSEIVQSAEENSTAALKGIKYLPSRFEWSIGWSYNIDYSIEPDEDENSINADIELDNVRITYNIKITLPTLIDDTVLNPAEKILWNNYYHNLLQYEHDHARIIRDNDAKAELLKKFRELDYMRLDYPSDIDIQKAVEAFVKKETEAIGSAWVKDLKHKIDAYDTATEYGLALKNRESFFTKK